MKKSTILFLILSLFLAGQLNAQVVSTQAATQQQMDVALANARAWEASQAAGNVATSAASTASNLGTQVENVGGTVINTLGGVSGSVGNFLNGTLGVSGTAGTILNSVGGLTGTATGLASGASSVASTVSGLASSGAGAPTMDIGAILALATQTGELMQHTGLLNSIMSTGSSLLGTAANDLSTTLAMYGNIGSTLNYLSGDGKALIESLANTGQSASNVFGGSFSSGSAPTGTSGSIADSLSAVSRVGEFFTEKTGQLYDIYANATDLISQAQGLAENFTIEGAIGFLQSLFGGTSNRLVTMTDEDINEVGFTTVAASLAESMNTSIAAGANQIAERFNTRKARVASLGNALKAAKDQSSVEAINAQIAVEQAGMQADLLALKEMANAADAARSTSSNSFDEVKRRNMQAMMRATMGY